MPSLDEIGTQRTQRLRMSARQRAILLVLLGATFLLAADLSLLNVAIPLIGRSLGFAVGDLQWIATSFALTAAGLTLFFGRIADRLGRRTLFIAGMALMVVASLVGGLATGPVLVIAARVGQGVATAMSTPAALALITTSFPEGPLRARALGANGATVSLGFTVGAVGSGVLTDLVSWRWAFLINVPVGLIIVALAPFLLVESRVRDRLKIDVPGALTIGGGLVALVYGVSRAGDLGWVNPVVLGFLALAAVLLVAFWQVELRANEPLASVGILRRPAVRWGNLGGLTAITMQTGVIFLVTLYLQEVAGYSPLATGLGFAVVGVAAFLGGVTAPRLIGRIGSGKSLMAGLAQQSLGPLGLLMLTGARSGIVPVLAVLCVASFGHVTAVVSYMVTGTSGLPDKEQGLATGLAIMTQQVALAVGIPILSAVATRRIYALATTHAEADAVLGGVRLAFLADASVVLSCIALLAIFLRSRR